MHKGTSKVLAILRLYEMFYSFLADDWLRCLIENGLNHTRCGIAKQHALWKYPKLTNILEIIKYTFTQKLLKELKSYQSRILL